MLVRRTVLGAGLAAPMLSACAISPLLRREFPLPRDPHSHARPAEARVRHVSLDLTADFDRRVLRGTATLSIEASESAREIVLDVHRLFIRSVRTNLGQSTWRGTAHHPEFGAGMIIPLWPGVSRIVIEYETMPDALALQWLSPAQTSSGKPFLFSQGQAILTRSWIPTQDSPGIRQTYDARIVVPEDLTAVMSAHAQDDRGGVRVDGGRAFRFYLNRPIPPYLIALGIGDLQFRRIGGRTGVYAEPGVVDAAASEFADMERMLETAEDLYGAYRWGRYDVLVLPPSFPYGGMENPTLTFLTPTVLAGDRSLVSLVAHELAHSWSGNLVTNALWADFWLNEGFTSYIESRIVEELYGAERANMARSLDWAGIERALAENGEDATRLHLVGERGPDDYVNAIAYDKGALFLRTIERIIGRERMDGYLRSYFDRYAFQPMTTERFIADFRRRVVRGDAALEEQLQLDAWAYGPGLPSNAEAPRSESFERIAGHVASFNAGGAASALPWPSWGTLERQRFLQTLPRELPRERLDELEAALQLNETGNSEVLFDWLSIAVRNRYEPSVPALEQFLTRQGRGKFVRPLYQALMAEGDWGQNLARSIYARARPGYHSVVASAVDEIVTPPG